MLTRIEMDGFKSFEGFSLDLGPLTVILGPNASGKSNLFDAIRFLSNLAGADLRKAVRGLRGEPHELFRRQPDGKPGSHMRFAVEVLLEPRAKDPWGATVNITHSRIRYEVVIERRTDEHEIERLVVSKEEAKPILRRDDGWAKHRSRASKAFRGAFLRYSRTAAWLDTAEEQGGKRTFRIGQDGHAGRKRSAEAAEATVLSSITSAEFPHLYALREELRTWRFLQLDPGALRKPSPVTAAESLEPDGSNLATVLARIQAETRTNARPKGALADIAADLASLVSGVADLSVSEDEQNREYRIDVAFREGPPFTSRVISDGTLRLLALLALLHDPKRRGLVCFEEPENGIHPSRVKALIEKLRNLVADPSRADVDNEEPLSQILLNSHSPVVLSSLQDTEMLFAEMVSLASPGAASVTQRTRIRPVRRGDTEGMFDADEEVISSAYVNRYLSTVEAAGADR